MLLEPEIEDIQKHEPSKVTYIANYSIVANYII